MSMAMPSYAHGSAGAARGPDGNGNGHGNGNGRRDGGVILHTTSVDNVVNGRVRDPARVKHGVVMGKRIADLSWWIDPATHLNLDLPGHLLETVFLVSRLEKGARVLAEGERFVYAPVEESAYRHLGKVDVTEKRRVSLRQAASA